MSYSTRLERWHKSKSKKNLNVLKNYARVQRKDLESSYKKMKLQANDKGIMFVSKEQETVASDILTCFSFENKYLVTLIAEPQWGKTGTILTAAYYLCTQGKDHKLIDADNVFILTGLSDTDWQTQTKERMLPQFKDNVYHRGQIKNAIQKLKNTRNALIIIDECHTASKIDQTLKKTFQDSHLLDISNLQKRNIRILQTSATPDNVLIDSQSWRTYHKLVKPHQKSKTYTSFADLFAKGRIKESLDLTDPCDAETLFDDICNFEPRYHIIRLPRRGEKSSRNCIVENILAFCQDHKFKFLTHESEKRINAIDQLLNTPPKVHTIIMITDFWRAAKTINDQYVGVVHERLVQNPNSTTVVQSLAGRFVGHNRSNHGPIIYTHVTALKQYISLGKVDFDYLKAKYRSTGLSSDGKGKLLAQQSYAHECNGIEHKYLTGIENRYGWMLFFRDRKGSPRDQAEKFVKTHLGKKLPQKTMQNGFYVQNDVREDPLYKFSKYFRDNIPYNKRIFKGLSGNNAKKKTDWRQYALYKDCKDKSTLVWFVCWRKNAFPDAPTMK